MCEICGLTEKDFQGKFARKNFLEHLNSKVHVNQKFTCDQCDQEFQHKKGLREHQAAKHEANIFKCESCNKDFKETLNNSYEAKQDKILQLQHM